MTQCHFLTLGEAQYLVMAGDDGMIDFWDFRNSPSVEGIGEAPSCPRLAHGEKVNWLACAGATVMVADTTSAWKMYKVS